LTISLPFKKEFDHTGSKKIRVLRPLGEVAHHYASSMAARTLDLQGISAKLADKTLSASAGISSIIAIITECMTSAYVGHHKKKAHEPYTAPWWSPELTVARDKFRELRDFHKKGKSDGDAWSLARKSYNGLFKNHNRLFQQKSQMELINSYFLNFKVISGSQYLHPYFLVSFLILLHGISILMRFLIQPSPHLISQRRRQT
jgi:hypothetical protein